MSTISRVNLSDVTYQEQPRPSHGTRWLFQLSRPIPYSRDDAKGYADGADKTDHVVVSWGRDGDTLIAPAALHESGKWVIADMLGYWSDGSWVDADEAMSEWFSEANK